MGGPPDMSIVVLDLLLPLRLGERAETAWGESQVAEVLPPLTACGDGVLPFAMLPDRDW